MERNQQPNERVRISKEVYEGIEFIRRSGVTNMLDLPAVRTLAREWELTEAADWLEGVDRATYGQLIFYGPEVVDDDETLDERLDRMDQAYDDDRRAFWEGEGTPQEPTGEENEVPDDDELSPLSQRIQRIRTEMGQLLPELTREATSTIEDSRILDEVDFPLRQSERNTLDFERMELLKNVGQAAALWTDLEQALTEAERGIGSLQYLSDPENY